MASDLAGSMPNVDLDKAIEQNTISVLLTPDSQENKPLLLNGLGNLLLERFNRFGDLADLNSAIEFIGKALLLTPDTDLAKPSTLNNIGVSYHLRFKRLGELSDLSKAIEFAAAASKLTPDSHSQKPKVLYDLGSLHGARFERLSELSDLNKATNFVEAAVLMTPDGHTDKPQRLNNLGNLYRTRFEHLGELSDLNNAIKYLSNLIVLIPEGHMAKPGALENLGTSHHLRFESLGELLDLNKAIEFITAAASLLPDGHPNKPGILSNLGNVHRTRFEHLGDLADLNKANECVMKAVSLIPIGHLDRSRMIGDLATSHLTRFQRLGELLDLDKAIDCAAEAALLTPDGHPDKSRIFSNLGHSYVARYDRLQASSDLDSAVVSFKAAAQSPIGPPNVRLEACRTWARLAPTDSVHSPRLAYQHAMQLLPQVLWAGVPLTRRHGLLRDVADLTSEAVSHAIATDAYELALEWLEEGRSTLWNQVAPSRLPLDELAAQNPDLASKLGAVARELEHLRSQSSSTSVPGNNVTDPNQDVSRSMQLALEWDALLCHTRFLPGFEDFLCPPKANKLMRAAESHPVVIINAHRYRCDALILQPNSDTISHVPLPEFDFEKATAARDCIATLSKNRKPSFQQGEPDPLEKPLEHLWFNACNRLSWIYAQPNAFDLVISSYAPNLSTLLARHRAAPGAHCSILGVGQGHTPNQSSLPGAKDELVAVEKHAQNGLYLQLEGEEATMEQVLDAMDQFDWVHLACHGSQDPNDPMKSAFHLHDGDLTLAAITKRSFSNKGLAFLSGCQTVTGDKNKLDEVVHLGTGMLMAGFPSVISTLWGSADEDGALVADRVYAELLKDGEMDHTKAARALHQAVAHLREKTGEKVIARWASFIHIGA